MARVGLRRLVLLWGALVVAGCAPAENAGPDAAMDQPLWFEDVTVAAGISFERQAANGLPLNVPDQVSGGICVIDVDHEPPLDLFFAIRPSAAGGSRLYVGAAPLAYLDETEARGLADIGDAMACLAYDEDGDGDDDLLVLGLGTARLFHQQDGRFVDASAQLGLTVERHTMLTGAAAGDIDADGDLDLLLGAFVYFDPERLEGMTCEPAATPCAANPFNFTPLGNLLLARGADGRYTDVTAARASQLLDGRPTLVVAIHDLDNDGTQDLFEGNDDIKMFPDPGYDRAFVRGIDGVFADNAAALGLDRTGYGRPIATMGWASGDVNGDGYFDHAESDSEFDRTALFVWRPGLNAYEDVADEANMGLASSSFRWGLALVDVDLDGDDDILEATGHVLDGPAATALGYWGPFEQPTNLYVNNGAAVFDVILPRPEDALALERSMRGLSIVDLDDDGRPDAVLAPAVGRPLVMHNVRATVGHWLRIQLIGRSPNTAAAGAVVRVRSGARVWIREKRIGYGFGGSADPRLMLGLGDVGVVDVEVRWASGDATNIAGIAADQEIVIEQAPL